MHNGTLCSALIVVPPKLINFIQGNNNIDNNKCKINSSYFDFQHLESIKDLLQSLMTVSGADLWFCNPPPHLVIKHLKDQDSVRLHG